MTIGKRMRFEILKRDGFRCMYCGKCGDQKGLHVDHIIPRSKGGTDEPSNLVAACRDCNAGKSNVSLKTTTAAKTVVDKLVDRELFEAAFWARSDAQRIEEWKRGTSHEDDACWLEHHFPYPNAIPNLLNDEPDPEIAELIAQELGAEWLS